MKVLLEVRCDNEYNEDAPSHGLINITPELVNLVMKRFALVEQVAASDDKLVYMEFWDGHEIVKTITFGRAAEEDSFDYDAGWQEVADTFALVEETLTKYDTMLVSKEHVQWIATDKTGDYFRSAWIPLEHWQEWAK